MQKRAGPLADRSASGMGTVDKRTAVPLWGMPGPALRIDPSAGQILFHHQRHLESNGVVELPQVQAGELFDLLQPVHQGVPVDEELPGGLGDVQVVLKETMDGKQGFLVQGVDGIFLEEIGRASCRERV